MIPEKKEQSKDGASLIMCSKQSVYYKGIGQKSSMIQ